MENHEYAIVAKNISKTFHITEDSNNTIKQRLFNLFNSPKAKKVQALKPVSLEIMKGECIGLFRKKWLWKIYIGQTIVRCLYYGYRRS